MITQVILLTKALESLIFIVSIVAGAGLIVLGVVITKKYVKPLQIQKDEIDEDQAIQEELDRVLVPIEDEEIQKQMDENMKNNEK